MEQKFDLERYLTHGVEHIVKDAIRATLKDPAESIFMAKYALVSKKSSRLRQEAEEKGEHIPPFLIASITSQCNLHCAGCYARTNHTCTDEKAVGQLRDTEWQNIFEEAREMGVGFILLAGGEPLIRQDVLKMAGNIPEILFPVFTNGTMLDDTYLQLFDRCRNLVPVFSIEGNEAKTDERRGNGIYQQLITSMEKMKKHHLIFGASVTVTTSNMEESVSAEFLDRLVEQGCKAVFYIEYVPVTEETKSLAFGDEEREFLKSKLDTIRKEYPQMVFISFPGDEKTSGGCLAAGRGFFHINSQGGAEPCPFSPYSDINVRDTSLREALKSKLFVALQTQHVLMEDHAGGCVLFERKSQVEELLQNS